MAESNAGTLIGMAASTMSQLRAGLMSQAESDIGESDVVSSLRNAGYAGGDAIFAAFEKWVRDAGRAGATSAGDGTEGSAGDLALTEFETRASGFFRNAGWGEVKFSSAEGEGAAVVDIVNCWEGAAAAGEAIPACHLTTGMLAGFFGRIAGYTVAVLETECCATGSPRCRFMMGNAEAMNYAWESMRQAGADPRALSPLSLQSMAT